MFGALRNPTPFACASVWTGTFFVLLTCAVVGWVDEQAVFFKGVAIVGLGYFFAIVIEAKSNDEILITTKLLDRVFQHPMFEHSIRVLLESGDSYARSIDGSSSPFDTRPNADQFALYSREIDTIFSESLRFPLVEMGNLVFALAFGMLGGIAAVWQRRRDQALPSTISCSVTPTTPKRSRNIKVGILLLMVALLAVAFRYPARWIVALASTASVLLLLGSALEASIDREASFFKGMTIFGCGYSAFAALLYDPIRPDRVLTRRLLGEILVRVRLWQYPRPQSPDERLFEALSEGRLDPLGRQIAIGGAFLALLFGLMGGLFACWVKRRVNDRRLNSQLGDRSQLDPQVTVERREAMPESVMIARKESGVAE